MLEQFILEVAQSPAKLHLFMLVWGAVFVLLLLGVAKILDYWMCSIWTYLVVLIIFIVMILLPEYLFPVILECKGVI